MLIGGHVKILLLACLCVYTVICFTEPSYFFFFTSGFQSTISEATSAAKYSGTEGFLHDGLH